MTKKSSQWVPAPASPKIEIKRPTTVLKEGDEVWIIRTYEGLVDKTVVERARGSYAFIDGKKYWIKGPDAKHRSKDNYLEYAMLPKFAIEVVDKEDEIEFERRRREEKNGRDTGFKPAT